MTCKVRKFREKLAFGSTFQIEEKEAEKMRSEGDIFPPGHKGGTGYQDHLDLLNILQQPQLLLGAQMLDLRVKRLLETDQPGQKQVSVISEE